jgi:hypothetical protein
LFLVEFKAEDLHHYCGINLTCSLFCLFNTCCTFVTRTFKTTQYFFVLIFIFIRYKNRI